MTKVLAIMADDMRADLIQYMPFVGGQLRSTGIDFPNARQVVPVCQAARAGFLTGQYPNGSINGVYNNGDGTGNGGMVTDNIGTFLQDQGVKTGFIGKCPNVYRQATPRAGWDKWNIIVNNEQQPYTCTWADNAGGHASHPEHEVKHGATLAMEFATQYVNDDWFLWWCPTSPHIQGQAPFEQNPFPKSLERFVWKDWKPIMLTDTSTKPTWIVAQGGNMSLSLQKLMQQSIKQQLREIYDLDAQIKRVFDHLVGLGDEEEVIIMFWSDNGAYYAEQDNQNFLGSSKDAPYDPACKVPMVFWQKDMPGAGTTNRTQVSPSVDVMATCLDVFSATGIAPDGQSLFDFAGNEDLSRATLYMRAENTEPDAEGIFEYDRKLIRYIDGTGTPAIDLVAVPTDEYEMYILPEDPDELVNVANNPAYLTERNRLEGRLDSML